MKKIMMVLLVTSVFSCQGEADKNQMLVYIDSHALQCEYGGDTLQQTAQPLLDNDIEVIASECGFKTGFAVITLCGAGTLDINLHKINKSDVEAAGKLGYLPISELQTESGSGYQFSTCENRGIYFTED